MAGDHTFHLVITGVTGALFDGEATSLTVPATLGIMTVLANHEPLISNLKAGAVRFTNVEGAETSYPVEGGVIECAGNRVTVLL